MPTPRASKICTVCGREFAWRRKWARCWSQVRYCSAACRGRGLHAGDRALEAAILDLLASRKGTICPSEAARRVSPAHWQALMQSTRAAGRRLAQAGRVSFLQHGRVVDPGTARGAVRLGRGNEFWQQRDCARG